MVRTMKSKSPSSDQNHSPQLRSRSNSENLRARPSRRRPISAADKPENQVFVVTMIMFISRFSQLGVRAIKGLSKAGPFRSTYRTTNNILERCPWQFLRHESLSTSVADKVQDEGNKETQKISVTFVDKDGDEKQINVPIGMSMLEAAHENDIELEGACEGSLACSTCHVIVMDMEYYNKIEDPTDEENDMLDLAFGLTETSRLGCQVIANPELDGLRLALPPATRNFAVDGYKPKPH